MFLKFLIKNIIYLQSGNIREMGIALFKLGSIPAVLITVNEQITGWYITNYSYMIMVLSALILDHVFGTIVHLFYKRDFVFKANYMGLLTKIGGCVGGYVILEMLREILKDADFLAIYLKVLVQTMVFLYPAGSALANLSIITHGQFPPVGWMKKLENFQKNANLNELKPDHHEKSYDYQERDDENADHP